MKKCKNERQRTGIAMRKSAVSDDELWLWWPFTGGHTLSCSNVISAAAAAVNFSCHKRASAGSYICHADVGYTTDLEIKGTHTKLVFHIQDSLIACLYDEKGETECRITTCRQKSEAPAQWRRFLISKLVQHSHVQHWYYRKFPHPKKTFRLAMNQYRYDANFCSLISGNMGPHVKMGSTTDLHYMSTTLFMW